MTAPELSRQRSITDLLGTGNAALIVTGLMLPVGGVIARMVALFPVADPLRLAPMLPASELAVVGAMPILTVAIALAGVRLLRPVFSPNGRKLATYAFAMVLVITAAFNFLTGGDIALSLFLLPTITLGWWIAYREAYEPLRGHLLVATLIAMYGLSSAAYGTQTRLGPAFEVVSNDQARLPDGAYLRLAENEDWIVLAPCASHQTAWQLPKTVIARMATLPIPDRAGVLEPSDPYRFCP